MESPLLDLRDPLPFDQIRAEHVEPAVKRLLEDADQKLRAIESAGDETLDALDAATEKLELAMSVIQHLEGSATTPELRDAYNGSCPT